MDFDTKIKKVHITIFVLSHHANETIVLQITEDEHHFFIFGKMTPLFGGIQFCSNILLDISIFNLFSIAYRHFLCI